MIPGNKAKQKFKARPVGQPVGQPPTVLILNSLWAKKFLFFFSTPVKGPGTLSDHKTTTLSGASLVRRVTAPTLKVNSSAEILIKKSWPGRGRVEG
ncbi:hypothetical protein EGI32_11310 [Ferruginibacter sp. HRS2-29]|nr:hypothetical protein [Ferruginibacter sp. HRS2-29]MCP9751554.1 hypothetical protein [Ferruginibacter sp. HRS2-29]